jgi:hypothetical protein
MFYRPAASGVICLRCSSRVINLSVDPCSSLRIQTCLLTPVHSSQVFRKGCSVCVVGIGEDVALC